MNWYAYNVWSTWIIKGRYITCLSVQRQFEDVLAAVQEKVEELGGYTDNQPIVLVSANFLSRDEVGILQALEDGKVTLILE